MARILALSGSLKVEGAVFINQDVEALNRASGSVHCQDQLPTGAKPAGSVMRE